MTIWEILGGSHNLSREKKGRKKIPANFSVFISRFFASFINKHKETSKVIACVLTQCSDGNLSSHAHNSRHSLHESKSECEKERRTINSDNKLILPN